MARAAASTCFVVSVYIQSSKLPVCKHLDFLAPTRPVQSLQSGHVFYVPISPPLSQPPWRSRVNPTRKMWPRSHHPPTALHPASEKRQSYPPPPECKSLQSHTPSGFTLHPLFCNPILHNCVTLWFTEVYLRCRRQNCPRPRTSACRSPKGRRNRFLAQRWPPYFRAGRNPVSLEYIYITRVQLYIYKK